MPGHNHRDPVTLPNGAVIHGCSLPADGYDDADPADFGLYFDPKWSPPWPHGHVHWPDFGLPADAMVLTRALEDLLARARRGERVELGCLGGHGRTGTALACLAVLAGHDGDPVSWARARYCSHAVETEEQATFAREFEVE